MLPETTPEGKSLVADLRESGKRQMSDLLTQFSLEGLRAPASGLRIFVDLVRNREGQRCETS